MSEPFIPLIDIAAWRTGTPEARAELAARMDEALRRSGFLLVSGHGIAPELRAAIREQANVFFALPEAAKAAYTAPVGGRGWIRPGGEANSFYGEAADVTRADLKESLTFGREHRTGNAAIDEVWFEPNRWPSEVPGLGPLCEEFVVAARGLYEDLLRMCAVALGLEEDWFTSRVQDSPHTFNINRYPSLRATGHVAEGQYRIAPHTDWGMLTILDRQPGYGGLQVETLDGEWVDAPFEPDAFTINVADLLSRWTGDHWRSTRHRVLPPSADAPDEELISVILFLEADVDAVVTPLRPGSDHEPVVYGEYLLERTLAASVP